MSEPQTDIIVVPARYGSSRLPGKPLLKLTGRTLLERVVANARRAASLTEGCDVVVATDDQRIADHAKEIGAGVVMTDPTLDSGTARAHAAASQLGAQPERVICLQGDAPFISPDTVAALIAVLRKSGSEVATPVFQLDWGRLDLLRAHKQNAPFSGTTCVRAEDGRALWFSKAILPALRNEKSLRDAERPSPVWQHQGLYAYTMQSLDWFVRTPPGRYEVLEGLEQLRFLEHGKTIATVPVEAQKLGLSGIDTPADLELAEAAIREMGDPFPA
ncbi:3-deoxy-manno-octulosonate cytidylyltransferase [Erythrobacter rubeus]|uniref:3-deoxy-manno-octulosonate cytidylyltransferase n=1 Tax=Erythrobacter rubeus TaxID=2760803 RepID=A0ABR8KNT0_9SPHN|nr:3-deoxy-manno-octulosonate cytidylyltransferase [Erythrobacter rubeus]MBD2841050.1 3-deoxy-manno-octulosonate cytidylyltransferase [Erythrobacter rubeus]